MGLTRLGRFNGPRLDAMSSSSDIRGRLGHPVIDIDGHMAEFFPTLAPYLEAEGLSLDHPSLLRLAPPYGGTDRTWHDQTPAERAATRTPRGPWWSTPAATDHRPGHRPLPRAALRAPRRPRHRLRGGVPEPRAWSSSTPPTSATAGARAAPSTGPTPRPSPRWPTGSPRWPPSPCTPPRRRWPSSSTPWASSASRRWSAPGTCSGPSPRWPTRIPRCPATPSGSTSSASTRPYDYDPVWAEATRARGVHRLPLRLHRHDPLPFDLELRVQPPVDAGRGPAGPGQVAVPRRGHPTLPRTSTSPSSKAAWPGPPPSTATSSATGRSATWAPCAATSTRPWSTASCWAR